jgi:hypothetical protein
MNSIHTAPAGRLAARKSTRKLLLHADYEGSAS